MSRTYSAASRAPVSEAWSLLAEPARWPEWAPHVRGAWGLGAPEVQAGRRGAARLLGVVPVPARISAKDADRSWTWDVGPLSLVHAVTPRGRGCVISITLDGPGLVERAYGPVCGALVRRLARVAERA